MIRRAEALLFAVLLASVLAAACGSSTETSVNVAGPTPVRCQPQIAAQSSSFGPAGGPGTLSVSVARECTWTATANAPWIVVTAGREGQGDGTVSFRIGENEVPAGRQGTIAVGENSLQISQEPAPCRFVVSAASSQVPAEGGSVAIDIRTHSACSWTVTSNAPWASPAPPSGSGDGAVRLGIAQNTGDRRAVEIVAAGQTLTITQDAPSAAPAPPPPAPAPPAPAPPAPAPPTPAPPAPTPTPPSPAPTPPPAPTPTPTPTPPPVACSYEMRPESASFGAEGGSRAFEVRTAAACQWTAASSAAWVTIDGAHSGTGQSDIRYSVAENFATTSRAATISVGGETFRISQARAQEQRLDGRISSLTGSCPNLRFQLDGRTVTTDRDTEFREGRCADARNGTEVEIRGYKQPDGTILARRVEFDD